MIRKVLLSVIVLFAVVAAKAQVPNFGTTAGDKKMYGYSSMKYRPKTDTWETYSTLQYCFTNYINIGADLYTGANNSI